MIAPKVRDGISQPLAELPGERWLSDKMPVVRIDLPDAAPKQSIYAVQHRRGLSVAWSTMLSVAEALERTVPELPYDARAILKQEVDLDKRITASGPEIAEAVAEHDPFWVRLTLGKSPYEYVYSEGNDEICGEVALIAPVPHGIENATMLTEAIGATASAAVLGNIDAIYRELDSVTHAPIY